MEHAFWWLEPVGVVVTAVATIVLAALTRILARETKRLAEIGQQPQVVFTIEPSDFEMNFLYNHIQNVGTATAYDIRVTFSPEVEFQNTQNTIRAPIKKVSLLKAGQQMSSFMCSYDELATNSFIVTTYWKRSPKTETEESLSYNFNLSDFEQVMRLNKQTADSSLEKIAKSLGNLESGFKRLKIDVFDEDDRDAERTAINEALQARRAARQAAPKLDE